MDEFVVRQRVKQMLKARANLLGKVQYEYTKFVRFVTKRGVPKEVAEAAVAPHRHQINSAAVGTTDEIMSFIEEETQDRETDE